MMFRILLIPQKKHSNGCKLYEFNTGTINEKDKISDANFD